MSLSDLETRIAYIQVWIREDGDLTESEIIDRFVKEGYPLSRASVRRVLDVMVSRKLLEEYSQRVKKQGNLTVFYKLKEG